MIKDGAKKEKCAVQIVSAQADPDTGTVSQQSAIGRALLGNGKDEAIECALPIGEVTLEILSIDKSLLSHKLSREYQGSLMG